MALCDLFNVDFMVYKFNELLNADSVSRWLVNRLKDKNDLDVRLEFWEENLKIFDILVIRGQRRD